MSCQRQCNPILPDGSGATSLPPKSKEGARDAPTKGDWFKERDSHSCLFLLVFLTLIGLEKMRQLIFSCQLEMFDGLGGELQESNSDGEINREGIERWAEEEQSGDQQDNINRMLEGLGRQRRERLLSAFETEGDPEGSIGKGKSREVQIDRESTDLISAISQYIVLESNLVTCGAGLEIHQITPGYDLCQISLQLPIKTSVKEIVGILLGEGLDTSDFHILRIEETGEWLEATILTNIRFGNTLGHKNGAFGNRQINVEVRRDAIWTSGTMGPGNRPSLILTWNAGESTLLAETALTAVYDKLYEFEGARMESCCILTPDLESAVKQVMLTVEFDHVENAMKAARDIRLKRPRTIPSFQAKISERQQSIVIPLLQYEAQREQWVELADTEREGGQIEFDIVNDEVRIRVQGEDHASVGALKVRVEELTRGEVLDGAYWHPSFAYPEESANFFREVSAIVHLKCCSDAHTLVLYGESGYIEDARRMIQAEVNRKERVMTKTALTRPSISFFKNGGIQKLKDLVGEKKVDLKSTSRWSAIMMQGGETATHHLRRLIKESFVREPIGFQDSTSATTCPVCFEEQLHPEMMECGHGYCSGCVNLLLQAAADDQKFPIVCVGDGATCKVPIALPFIHRFLPPHTFKLLVEAAFATYLQKNPTQFRYCKTPDCRQTYRHQSEDKATINICPSCFAQTCSSCSEDHENMTCAEYRILRDPEEQQRLSNELARINGYKRCPRCAVWVEKIGGCNHMSCKCGAHICWVCLGIFSYDKIYNHIYAHGLP